MDRIERYREAVRRIVDDYARLGRTQGPVETEAIIDCEHDHYEVIDVGWDDQRRIHTCVIHIDIRGGKVWVQHDATNRPVVDELLAAGIPREDIVLGFHPPDVRKYTEFAVG